ncbi:MAG: LysM peptidoglycan-binding domain-containing protein, partial [Kiritimatiellae bacterium]|nr:LysM peptidoglycan-binding domain-containing protein [Kiritimatiellia bacterium]
IVRHQEVLMQAPRTASAHLDLPLLLHDYRKDYIGAIYHYRRYLALRPETEKAPMISNRLQVAEQLLAAQSVKKISAGDAGGQVLLMQQLDALNQRLVQAEGEKERLAGERDRLTAQVRELQGQVSRLQRWVDRLQSPTYTSGGGARQTSPVERGFDDGTPRTYEVRDGDSLSRIAESVYGDPAMWPRIRDANRDKLRDGERVRVGDILTIP